MVGECGRWVRPPPTAKGGLFPPFAVGGVVVTAMVTTAKNGGGGRRFVFKSNLAFLPSHLKLECYIEVKRLF